jgi:hypothetical protein
MPKFIIHTITHVPVSLNILSTAKIIKPIIFNTVIFAPAIIFYLNIVQAMLRSTFLKPTLASTIIVKLSIAAQHKLLIINQATTALALHMINSKAQLHHK